MLTRRHTLSLAAAGLAPRTEARFFNEFVLEVPLAPARLRAELARRGVHAGVAAGEEYGLGHAVVLAATESTTDADIAALVAALQDVLASAHAEAVHG